VIEVPGGNVVAEVLARTTELQKWKPIHTRASTSWFGMPEEALRPG
jgi:hypothetical protein